MADTMYKLFPESSHEKVLHEYFGDEGFGGISDFSGSFDKKSLVVCFTNRCGSTFLISQLMKYGLASEPNEYMNFEYFNGNEVVEICKKNNINSFDGYVDHVYTKYSKNDQLITKLSIDQLVLFAKKGYLKKYFRNAKFLFIERKDIVSQAVSLSIALQSGLWTSKHESKKEDELTFDIVAMRNYCKQIANSNAYFKLFFELHGVDVLSVYYEDLLKDELAFRGSLEVFLDVKLSGVTEDKMKLKKQRTEVNSRWKNKIREIYSGRIR